jgi:glycosyltransferase involved in cell wall biosynthesis
MDRNNNTYSARGSIMKTRVWIVIWGLKDGGAEILAKDYARLADKHLFETTIVTMYPFTNTANYRLAQKAEIKVISIFEKRNILTRVTRFLVGKWYVPWRLHKLIERENPNTIHFNSKMAHYFVPLSEKLAGVNLLYTCHSEVSKHFFEKEENAVRQMAQDHGLRLIALHDDMKNELDQRFSKTDTVVIRNGVDLGRFRKEGIGRETMRESIGIESNAYVVGHIGRFSEAKNHTFLLKVFQALLQRKNNAHLLLVGNGELREQIIDEIRKLNLEAHVTILSHRTDIPDLLHAMDVMVFPSFYEGLSVTLVEAQASGLRCVISDSINPANLLSENTIPVSLDADEKEWADIVLNSEIKNTKYGNIEDYDMGREIRRLERLYLGEQDV